MSKLINDEKTYYAIRNNQILEVKIVKLSNRGTGYWCKVDGIKRNKLISANKIFPSSKDAKNAIKNINRIKRERAISFKREIEREKRGIDLIMDKLWNEFGFECKFLDRPCSIEEAENLYHYVKYNHNQLSVKGR